MGRRAWLKSEGVVVTVVNMNWDRSSVRGAESCLCPTRVLLLHGH